MEFRLNTALGNFNTLKTPLHGDHWEERILTGGEDFFPKSTDGSTWKRTREIKLDVKRRRGGTTTSIP